jgi:hypothetical protein
MRARWYSAANARWERLDPFHGNPTDPFSFNKYGFVHGNPVMGTDPTGLAEFTIAGITVTISAKTFNAFAVTSAISYGVGKAIEALYLEAVEGDLQTFKWFTSWDLLSFVPGGVVAAAFAKFIRYPAPLLTRIATGGIRGKAFVQGLHNQLGQAFSMVFPQGKNYVLLGLNGPRNIVLNAGSGSEGFVHMIRRHLAHFYDGTKPNVTTFWPIKTTPEMVLHYLDEAVTQLGPKLYSNTAFEWMTASLRNGMTVVVGVENGIIKTIYPEAGAGVTKLTDMISRKMI